MTVQAELIGQLLMKYGSKKEAADAAGLSLSRFSHYFHEKRKMDDEAVIGCAEALGKDPAPLLYQHKAEIATSARESTFWRKVAGSAVALFVVLGATTLPAPTANASQRAGMGLISQKTAVNAYYVSGRAFLTLLGDVLRWLRWRFSRRTPGPDNIEAFAA